MVEAGIKRHQEETKKLAINRSGNKEEFGDISPTDLHKQKHDEDEEEEEKKKKKKDDVDFSFRLLKSALHGRRVAILESNSVCSA
jgi:hypothetical protein